MRDGGRRKIICSGDWSVTPAQLHESGLLHTMGLTIITAGIEATCHHSHGSSLLDYIICDEDIACLIGNVSLEPVKVWGPHVALKFSINRRPEHILVQQLCQPKP